MSATVPDSASNRQSFDRRTSSSIALARFSALSFQAGPASALRTFGLAWASHPLTEWSGACDAAAAMMHEERGVSVGGIRLQARLSTWVSAVDCQRNGHIGMLAAHDGEVHTLRFTVKISMKEKKLFRSFYFKLLFTVSQQPSFCRDKVAAKILYLLPYTTVPRTSLVSRASVSFTCNSKCNKINPRY